MHLLERTLKKAFFFILTWRALVRIILIISCLCNVLFTGLKHDTTLDSPSALDREISLKNIHTYIQTWPEPVFYRLLDSSFAPSALSLRLNKIYYQNLLYRVSHNWCHTLAQFLFRSHSVNVRGISFRFATGASLGIRQSCDFSYNETLTNQRLRRGDFHGVQGARDPGV